MKVGCGPTSRGAFSRTEDEACLPAGRDGTDALPSQRKGPVSGASSQ
jgi:hypothetical protein